MGLVYLYPALKVLQSKGIDLEELDDNDRAAIFSMAYEVKGMQPITSMDVSEEKLTKKFSKIGAGDLIGALIQDDELNFSIAETIYRYMIEIKHKNNPQNLARWVAEYEDIFGTYDPLDAETLDKFLNAYNVAFAKYGSDVSRQTGLDYVFFGYVEHPELFESKNSLSEMTERFANHLRAYFSDSAFIRNKDNANYVAKSYMMAQKMCENTGFLDITDIYCSDICLVEHSYGYGEHSTEYILSDTQVVSLEGTLDEGDFDTDKDEVSDRDEIGIEEEVNISRLLEAYIKYNELPQEEADKLRATPTVKMYNYISNPVLPDSDFDGRGDLRDRGRALDNSYEMLIDTDVVDNANYDLNVDYRYFFMDNTKYYPELSDMAVLLSNMVTKKGWRGKSWHNKTENLGDTDIQSFMWHYGNEDIEIHDMSSYYDDANVCRYAIGQHDVVLRRGKVNNKVRNVITVAIGEIPEKTAELTANLYDLLGDNEEYSEYHHIGYDITAGRIFEKLLRYTENYNNNQKVFFITGARSAGGVANLLAKKLIDRFGPSSVYGYTFNAVSTINGNMIPEGTKIPNLKYAPIMNIYNDDEIMVMFTSEETDMYKYGTNVHMSLSENLTDKVKKAFRYVHKGNYDEDMKSKVVNILNRTFNIDLSGYTTRIYGMTGTEFNNEEFEEYIKDSNEEYEDYVKSGAKEFHSAFDELKIQKVTEIWELTYDLCVIDKIEGKMKEHAGIMLGLYKSELNRIQNMKKELGTNDLNSNNNYVALSSVINKLINLFKKIFCEPFIQSNSSNNEDIKVGATLKHLDELAVWYINHIATYGSQLKGKREYYNEATDIAKEYFNERVTFKEVNGQTTYRIKDEYKNVDLIMMNDKQLGGDGDEGRLGYKYDAFEDYAKNYITDTEKTYGKFSGDDCSGFVLGLIRLVSKGDLGKDAKNNGGLDLKNTNSYKIREDKNFEKCMLNIGFHKYYLNGTEWKHKYIKNGVVEDNETNEVEGINFLQPGDMLVCDGHVEFYNGFKYTIEYKDKREGKKSGIESITRGERLKPGINNNGRDTNDKGRAYGTFGWGRVRDVYPSEAIGDGGERNTYYYFTFNANTKMFELHYSSSSPGETTYKTIWRKQ